MCELVQQTGRRIGVLIDRGGNVDKVMVGDAHQVFLPDLGARRAGASRFRGVRLLLAGVRPDGLTEDDLTDLVLLQLDAVISLRVDHRGLPGEVHYAHLLPPEAGQDGPAWHRDSAPSIRELPEDWLVFISDLEAQFARSPQLQRVAGAEKAILVGITLGQKHRAERTLGELARLADTAGLQVVDSVLQNRQKLDGRTCVGKGKLQDLIVRSMHLGAEVLIFDRELSPSQLRNIATVTELKVLDRTQLILDIFAQHAETREGRMQVELAQLRYRMPRLAIMPTAMSRLTGGIGGRGPGETKLEMNRRRAAERLSSLEGQLKQISKQRALRRKKRTKAGLPVVSLVGYTNAGKSTLLNRMTQSDVLVEDKLFATLDPTSRRYRFPEEREIIITDTVGFIEDLPKTLVLAFKATLEELEEAHLMLHVLDASDDEVEGHLIDVRKVLMDLQLGDTPSVLVWNKAEITPPETMRSLLDRHGGFPISAVTAEGLGLLLDVVEQTLFRTRNGAKESHTAVVVE